jgi:hypothetical protein
LEWVMGVEIVWAPRAWEKGILTAGTCCDIDVDWFPTAVI